MRLVGNKKGSLIFGPPQANGVAGSGRNHRNPERFIRLVRKLLKVVFVMA